MNNEEKGDKGSGPEHEHHREDKHPHFEIQIDRTHYTVTMKHMTGLQLRHVPTPPIGPDRDLFEVVPGGSDRKIGDEQVVEIRNGLRFFTAPAQINPGREEYEAGVSHAAAY
jgi:hypothetical protein